LLAEDNRHIINRLQDALSRQGYQVHVAYNGREAVRLLRETAPQLIILDLQMPEIGGEEAWRLMQELPDWQDVPVILTSSLILPGDVERYRERGAVAYLPKPVSLARLKRVIAAALSASTASDSSDSDSALIEGG
jgi:two-component system cell cycle response regulator DivK